LNLALWLEYINQIFETARRRECMAFMAGINFALAHLPVYAGPVTVNNNYTFNYFTPPPDQPTLNVRGRFGFYQPKIIKP
jgi:hypothetical protein